MSWTEERIATLKKLWEGGATASQIAEALGEVSRNAVIGKAHRLGLKARPSPVKANEGKSAKTGAPAAPKGSPKTVSPSGDEAVSSAKQAKADPVKPIAADPAPPTAAVPRPTPASGSHPSQPMPGAGQNAPKVMSVGPGGFLRQGPGDQQPPIPPAPPRRLVPAKPSTDITDKTSLLDLHERVCRWPMGHPGEPDFHFCGAAVNPGFPYCVEHCGRAYQAQLPRGARRPPPPLPFGGPRVR